jgi:hypothetical protein
MTDKIALGSAATPTTATRVETDHLDMTSYMSDEVVAPGEAIPSRPEYGREADRRRRGPR